MGIMDIVRNWSKNKKELKGKFKEAEEQRKIERMLDEREKSSNERELERYMKEQRENNIKKQLDVIRKQKTKEMWKDNSILKGGTKILNDDKTMMKSGTSILKQKNIFKSGVPKRDGSGGGLRLNKGRGGCNEGKGFNKSMRTNMFTKW